MSKKVNRKPKGTKCCCGHSGGARHTQHEGGLHGIHHGHGRCVVESCRCRRFMARQVPSEPE